MFCSACGNAIDASANFCSGCGTVQGPIASPAPATAQSEEFYSAAIGPKNQAYYLRHFQRFDTAGTINAAWHWPAFFLTFYWFLYRKMWLNALIYFVSPYVLMLFLGIMAGALGKSGELAMGVLYLLYLVGVFVIPGMYGNALYYKHCRNKIAEVQASSQDVQRQLGELSGKGGTSNIALILIFVFGFIFTIGILAAIAIPAYQDYTTRARTSQALSAGRAATESVTSYYAQYQKIPNSLGDTGFSTSLPPSIQAISIDNQTGAIRITMAQPPISGKTFMLVPSRDANDHVNWKCMSQDIQEKYLPRECRLQ